MAHISTTDLKQVDGPGKSTAVGTVARVQITMVFSSKINQKKITTDYEAYLPNYSGPYPGKSVDVAHGKFRPQKHRNGDVSVREVVYLTGVIAGDQVRIRVMLHAPSEGIDESQFTPVITIT